MRWATLVCLLLLGGCGGGEKSEAEEPEPTTGEDTSGDAEGDVLIPTEKIDEVARLFESKSSVVARCFPEAMNAGELESSAEGFVTVGLTIQRSGEPTDVEVLDSNLESDTLYECVLDKVETWAYPEMPKPYTTSHIYQFQEL